MKALLLALSLLALLVNESNSFLAPHTSFPLIRHTIQTTECVKSPQNHEFHVLLAKNSGGDDNESNDLNKKVMQVFKKNPGTIIVAPFVLLFGFDLIANILVVTKRSLEGKSTTLECNNCALYFQFLHSCCILFLLI